MRVLDIKHVLETTELQDEIIKRNEVNRAKLKSLNAQLRIFKREVARLNDAIKSVNRQMGADYLEYLSIDDLKEDQ